MDCLTPTQQKAIPHGTNLTIEGVLELTEGGKLDPVAKDFEDTDTGPIPMNLRSSDEQRRLQLEAVSDSTATTTAIVQGREDQSQSLFLEAQSLATMKEIKQLIKQRRQEAEAAWQAQLEAERKAAKLQATRDGGHDDDDGSQGSGGLTASNGSTKPATPEKRRIIRSATAPWQGRALTSAKKWGRVTVQDEDEDDEVSLKVAKKAVEPEVVKSKSMDLVFGETLDAPVSEVLAPLGSTEVMVSDDEDGMTLEAEENKRPKASRHRMSYDEDLFPPMKDTAAADAHDVLDRQDFLLTYDDDWTLPTEEWLAYFTRDYVGPYTPPGLETFSSEQRAQGFTTRPKPATKLFTPVTKSYSPVAKSYSPMAKPYSPMAKCYSPAAKSHSPAASASARSLSRDSRKRPEVTQGGYSITEIISNTEASS